MKLRRELWKYFNLNLPIASRNSAYLGKHGVYSWSGACDIKFV